FFNRMVAKLLLNRGYILKYKTTKKYLPISSYSEAIYSRGEVYFEIDTSIACNFNQFFFANRHWHYHTKMTEEIIKNANVQYKGSILERYYNKYQPATFTDIYFTLKNPKVHDQSDVEVLNENVFK